MILRTTTGKSFKGVGKYVLNDKGTLESSDRVSFIETENLAFADGQRAIAEMVHTAVRQKEIKRRNGLRATKTNKPVYHLSLSWDTSEKPSLKEQMDAAREALTALGLDDHQAMIVGHTDTDNPHVHVVVNLVNPITGKSASLSNDQLKLSKWAERYRRDRGEEHFCPQRKKNNQRRKDGEFVKAQNMTRQEYEAWKASQTKDIWDAFRADRAKAKKSRRGQFDALWRQKEERIAQRRDEIKAYFKPQWRDLFKKQRLDLKNFDAGFFDRLGFAFSRQGRSKVVGFLEAITNDGQLRDEFIRKQDQERKHLGNQHKARIADASREARKAWQLDKDALVASHQAEDDRAHAEAKTKSQAVWNDDAPPQTSANDFADAGEQAREKPSEKMRVRKERKRSRPRRRPR